MLALISVTLLPRRWELEHRASAFGLGALLLFALAFNLPGSNETLERWTLAQWLATTATCGTVAFVMWRIFGPGEINDRVHETELQMMPGTT